MSLSGSQKVSSYLPQIRRTVIGFMAIGSLAILGGGCSHSPGDKGTVVTTPPPPPNPMATPLPANIPPAQAAQIRQQQAQALAQAQAANQQPHK